MVASLSPRPQPAVTLMVLGIMLSAVVVLFRLPALQPDWSRQTNQGGVAAPAAPAPQRSQALFADAGSDVASGKAVDDPRMARIRERFEQAVYMLHARRYDEAVTALHAVLLLSPRLTAAHVNMGYALLGLERYAAAADFFRQAIDLTPYQGNAYWGLAEALEAQGDFQGALGAMRTYIHLARPDDPFVRRARAALWEIENRLKHGPPSEEAQAWMAQRQREDEARNSPGQDSPLVEETLRLPVTPLNESPATNVPDKKP